jgi:hypothetical protein
MVMGIRQHLFVECVRYHLPPFKNLFDIQVEISGFIRWHADRVPHLATFVAVMPAQDQSLG